MVESKTRNLIILGSASFILLAAVLFANLFFHRECKELEIDNELKVCLVERDFFADALTNYTFLIDELFYKYKELIERDTPNFAAYSREDLSSFIRAIKDKT